MGACFCKRFDKDKWLKNGSLKRNPEDNAYGLSEETEEVSDCSSSKNPATSVLITCKKGKHYNLEIVSRIFCLICGRAECSKRSLCSLLQNIQ